MVRRGRAAAADRHRRVGRRPGRAQAARARGVPYRAEHEPRRLGARQPAHQRRGRQPEPRVDGAESGVQPRGLSRAPRDRSQRLRHVLRYPWRRGPAVQLRRRQRDAAGLHRSAPARAAALYRGLQAGLAGLPGRARLRRQQVQRRRAQAGVEVHRPYLRLPGADAGDAVQGQRRPAGSGGRMERGAQRAAGNGDAAGDTGLSRLIGTLAVVSPLPQAGEGRTQALARRPYCFFLLLLLALADVDLAEPDFTDFDADALPDFDAVLLPLAPLRLLLADVFVAVGTAGAAAGSLMVAPLLSSSSYASIMPSS
ncbi:hypothetical protein CBM2606_A40339 [Cupriavidus taiwanensis]|nr:hypothetical protein CBM2606_A40339 [Cupriavidus taiwanensis]